MREKVSVEEGGHRFSSERRQRLYASSELTDIVEKASLTVRSIHGDLTGSPFDEATSGKIVVVCEKSSADP
jgi:hypothetical protein